MKRTFLLFAVIFLTTGYAGTSRAAVNENDNDDKSTSGLPVPRFASLRSDDVNMRTGPGTRYPIEWQFTRQGLPVEIIGEYEVWRHVRDPEGAEGWMHKSALSGKRTAMIVNGPRDLRSDTDMQSAPVAHLGPNAGGQILSCAKDWCKLKFNDIKGYLRKSDFWGAEPGETFD